MLAEFGARHAGAAVSLSRGGEPGRERRSTLFPT
jgi:hypothetical protein